MWVCVGVGVSFVQPRKGGVWGYEVKFTISRYFLQLSSGIMHKANYRRMYKSMHSILHSLRPSRLRNHSIPRPVHSSLRLANSSAATLARALAVVLSISTAVALKLSTPYGSVIAAVPLLGHVDDEVVEGRGANQLLLKSKKQRSDQWQDVTKRMSRSTEQYTHGRLRKYVQTKKRKMNAGEAFVGMKRRGSQLL